MSQLNKMIGYLILPSCLMFSERASSEFHAQTTNQSNIIGLFESANNDSPQILLLSVFNKPYILKINRTHVMSQSGNQARRTRAVSTTLPNNPRTKDYSEERSVHMHQNQTKTEEFNEETVKDAVEDLVCRQIAQRRPELKHLANPGPVCDLVVQPLQLEVLSKDCDTEIRSSISLLKFNIVDQRVTTTHRRHETYLVRLVSSGAPSGVGIKQASQPSHEEVLSLEELAKLIPPANVTWWGWKTDVNGFQSAGKPPSQNQAVTDIDPSIRRASRNTDKKKASGEIETKPLAEIHHELQVRTLEYINKLSEALGREFLAPKVIATGRYTSTCFYILMKIDSDSSLIRPLKDFSAGILQTGSEGKTIMLGEARKRFAAQVARLQGILFGNSKEAMGITKDRSTGVSMHGTNDDELLHDSGSVDVEGKQGMSISVDDGPSQLGATSIWRWFSSRLEKIITHLPAESEEEDGDEEYDQARTDLDNLSMQLDELTNLLDELSDVGRLSTGALCTDIVLHPFGGRVLDGGLLLDEDCRIVGIFDWRAPLRSGANLSQFLLLISGERAEWGVTESEVRRYVQSYGTPSSVSWIYQAACDIDVFLLACETACRQCNGSDDPSPLEQLVDRKSSGFLRVDVVELWLKLIEESIDRYRNLT
ncbi:hypothetical protein BJ508DRAFT_53562 [Ascobolus immersus RN42]|uniref:Uncharacterized protein n=1 Tax=Ascobolus immersus RN42 TaxID=1160509 RepID=A0A3N4HGP9_ASCIM|nr:hypothetical protein BJ508DRAFT_53562 [Ascobolus immersus RN42]